MNEMVTNTLKLKNKWNNERKKKNFFRWVKLEMIKALNRRRTANNQILLNMKENNNLRTDVQWSIV